jgi:hypothetical protein
VGLLNEALVELGAARTIWSELVEAAPPAGCVRCGAMVNGSIGAQGIDGCDRSASAPDSDRYPHMLRAAFIMAALDAGVPLRDVQLAARHADPRTTMIYDHRRQNFDRHAAYVVVAFVAGG